MATPDGDLLNTERPIIHGTLDEVPRCSQELRLICGQCGERGVYDVGTIFADIEGKGASAKTWYGFGNYFRCHKCGAAGPWEIDNWLKLATLLLRTNLSGRVEGIQAGRCHLFDGTLVQSPAMGQEHLLKLLRQSPYDAFLHTRLGNLMRGCGQKAQAAEWYEKGLRLDPGDIEARYHLWRFAVEARDAESSALHARQLVRHLLEGRKTEREELNEGIALALVDGLREASQDFRERFLTVDQEGSGLKEDLFIGGVLAQTGEEEEIIREAAQRLLGSKAASETPAVARAAAQSGPDTSPSNLALTASLAELVREHGLNSELLTAVFEDEGRRGLRISDKHEVRVSDGEKMVVWRAPAIRELFRGNRQPPPDMDHYPEAYTAHFWFIEDRVLALCDVLGDRTDQEMEEVYASLRRRPDGRSLGLAHDFLWQVSALLLGCYPLSEAEYAALIGALLNSTRKWGLRPVSRFYLKYLREAIDEDGSQGLQP